MWRWRRVGKSSTINQLIINPVHLPTLLQERSHYFFRSHVHLPTIQDQRSHCEH
ncbi:hypothetical protein [Moorena producens]|uniref:hypothetical protein n=1 Tax=Moorena producens TaxID=1155739 RepID=UPI003C735861